VGNTSHAQHLPHYDQKHPHTRGEYCERLNPASHRAETPPHTWGIQPVKMQSMNTSRNTPTHVGNTCRRNTLPGLQRKHPHTRGEYFSHINLSLPSAETPPHTWGIRIAPRGEAGADGNTPTHVGNTFRHGQREILDRKHPHTRGEYYRMP